MAELFCIKSPLIRLFYCRIKNIEERGEDGKCNIIHIISASCVSGSFCHASPLPQHTSRFEGNVPFGARHPFVTCFTCLTVCTLCYNSGYDTATNEQNLHFNILEKEENMFLVCLCGDVARDIRIMVEQSVG